MIPMNLPSLDLETWSPVMNLNIIVFSLELYLVEIQHNNEDLINKYYTQTDSKVGYEPQK